MNLVEKIAGWFGKKSLAGVQAWLRGDDLSDSATPDRLVNPFATSAWVQRAIKRVAEPISAVDLEFCMKSAGGDETEVDDPALESFWEAPAIDRSGSMDFSDFITASVGWLKLSGECFWVLDDLWLTSRGAMRPPIIIARPDRMQAVLVENRLEGWIFTDAANIRHNLVKEQVIHLKFWNPYDDLRGLSEYESAKVASESDYLAGKFTLNTNRANGDRGVIVVAKGGMPGDEQREQIVRALREKANASKRGDFRPIFLTGDVAIEDPKVNSPDANFAAARLQNRHEIFIAFGVPPSMADIVASYSIGQASDRYMLISETCIPLSEKLAGGIQRVSRMFNTRFANVEAEFDWDEHPVMQQVRRERIDTGTKLWDRGVPWNVASEYLGLGLPEFAGNEKGYIPFSLQPVEADAPEIETPAEETAPTEEEDNSSMEAMIRALEAGPVERMEAALQVTTRTKDDKRAALWRNHMRAQEGTVRMFAGKFGKELMKARRETLQRISASAAPSKASTRALAADFVFSLADFKVSFSAVMRGAALEALDVALEQAAPEFGFTDPWKMPPPAVTEFLRIRQNRMTDVADEVFNKIKDSIQTSLDEGDSINDMAKKIRGKFNDLSKGLALTVAKTETATAYGVARQASMVAAGIEYKEWLTAHDDKVRKTHEDADGQVVPINEPFKVWGENKDGVGAWEYLLHPGDPAGSAANVINCRCIEIAATKPEEKPEN